MRGRVYFVSRLGCNSFRIRNAAGLCSTGRAQEHNARRARIAQTELMKSSSR